MSDDISELVRRLRYEAAHWYEELSARLMLQAADTLERLQALLEASRRMEKHWFNRAEKAEAAFLYYVQNDNGCEVTGKPCRNPEQCGCYQETQP